MSRRSIVGIASMLLPLSAMANGTATIPELKVPHVTASKGIKVTDKGKLVAGEVVKARKTYQGFIYTAKVAKDSKADAPDTANKAKTKQYPILKVGQDVSCPFTTCKVKGYYTCQSVKTYQSQSKNTVDEWSSCWSPSDDYIAKLKFSWDDVSK